MKSSITFSKYYVLIAAVLLFLVLAIHPSSSSALSCAPTSLSPEERISSSEYIFEGTVASNTGRGQSSDPSQVEITRVYKGGVHGNVTIQLSSMWDKLGLQPGYSYLFLFNGKDFDQQKNKFTRGLCDFQVAVDTSEEDYKAYEQALDNRKSTNYILAASVISMVSLVVLCLIFINKRNKGVKKSK